MVRRLNLGKNNHLIYVSLALNPRYVGNAKSQISLHILQFLHADNKDWSDSADSQADPSRRLSSLWWEISLGAFWIGKDARLIWVFDERTC